MLLRYLSCVVTHHVSCGEYHLSLLLTRICLFHLGMTDKSSNQVFSTRKHCHDFRCLTHTPESIKNKTVHTHHTAQKKGFISLLEIHKHHIPWLSFNANWTQ